MSDVKQSKGAFPYVKTPITTGRDFAGTILEGPQELLGKRVWGSGGGDFGYRRDGTFSEYITMNRKDLNFLPDGIAFTQAAASLTPFITAYGPLKELFHPDRKTLLVTGANGIVGSAAVQIGKWKGLKTIAVVRRDIEGLKESLNADHLINTSTISSLKEEIMNLTEGKGVDVIYDTIGSPMFKDALSLLAERGVLIEISSPLDKREVSLDLIDFYRRQLTLKGYNSISLNVDQASEIVRELTPGFASGALKMPNSVQTFPLEDFLKAYEATALGNRSVIINNTSRK